MDLNCDLETPDYTDTKVHFFTEVVGLEKV